MPPLIFFIKFTKERHPERIVVKDWQELQDVLNRLVQRYGEIYEWIIRD